MRAGKGEVKLPEIIKEEKRQSIRSALVPAALAQGLTSIVQERQGAGLWTGVSGHTVGVRPPGVGCSSSLRPIPNGTLTGPLVPTKGLSSNCISTAQ